jgi:hypothetical protein
MARRIWPFLILGLAALLVGVGAITFEPWWAGLLLGCTAGYWLEDDTGPKERRRRS